MIGGISYFHEFAYDLLAENERILAVDVRCGDRRPSRRPPRADRRRSAARWSTSRRRSSRRPEGAQLTSPPPISTYGFQKLASEYFAKGAWEQYQLPYTIVRPFNCVGIGERRAVRDTDIMSGNVKLALSPRRARPRPQGAQGPGPAPHPGRRRPGPPLHVRRRPGPRHPPRDGVAGGGQRRLQPLDRGVRRRSSSWPRRIWRKIHTDGRPFRYVSDPPFEHDVQLRVPDVRKAPRGPRLRGDDDARPDARRGHPWIRTELEAGPAVSDYPLKRPVRGALRRARGQTPSSRSGTRSRATSSATWIRRGRSSTSPATAATSSGPIQALGAVGDRHPRHARVAARRRAVRPVVRAGARCASCRPAHFGTVFMSNYLEHLESCEAVIKQLSVAQSAACARRPRSSSCNRTSGSSEPRYWDFIDHRVALTEQEPARGRRSSPACATDTLVTRFLPYSTKGRLPSARLLTRAYLAFPPAWLVMGKQTALRRDPRDDRSGSAPNWRSSCRSTTRANRSSRSSAL